MANFAALVRDMVALADSLTDSLQATVQHYAWSGATVDAYGKATWGAATPRKCVVEKGAKMLVESRIEQGHLVSVIGTKLTFPRPVSVDVRDRFQLPSGEYCRVLGTNGVTDPATSLSYANEVLVGEESLR